MSQGLILAGGFSSRLQKNKMTLPIGGTPLIRRTAQTLLAFSDSVVVVTGHYHEDTEEALRGLPRLTVVRNRGYERGMFSSIQYGARFLTPGNDFFILPGDVPLVAKATYERLLAAEGDVRIPVCENRRGHPAFFSGRLLPELRKENPESNLRIFEGKFPAVLVDVDDEGILLDVDTEADYEALLRHYERGKTA